MNTCNKKGTLCLASFCLMIFATLFQASAVMAQHENPDPLELNLKLRIMTRKLCLGDPTISLIAEVHNVSESTIAIQPRAIWYQLSFEIVTKTDGRTTFRSLRSISENVLSDDTEHVVLEPGEVFKASLDYKLAEDFFAVPGRYRARLRYGGVRRSSIKGIHLFKGVVDSNEVLFDIVRCRGGPYPCSMKGDQSGVLGALVGGRPSWVE